MEKTREQTERNEQIYQLSTLVAGQFSLQEVLDRLAEAAVKITGVKACSIRLLDEQAGDLRMRSTYGLSEEYRNKGSVSREDPVIKAAFAGKPVVLDDMRVDGRVTYRDAAVKEGLVSQLTVAMKFREKPIGVLRLYRHELQPFDEDDVTLARAVASQCAVAITNARLYAEAIAGQRLAEQMRLASIIQRRMIPDKPPILPGLDVAATYIPCFEVGGDFYDFLPSSDHSLSVVIADVIGKGVPAAIMMSGFRGALRAYAEDAADKRDLAAMVKRLNGNACGHCREGEFITMVMADIDIREMKLTYCNCGHEPGFVIRGKETIDLETGGMVLGLMPDAEYRVETIELQDGDVVLLYTDGLTDAANFEGRFWGRENLVLTAKDFTAGPAHQTVGNILAHRRRFTGLATQCDDTSLIAVKVDRTARPRFMEESESK